MRRAVCPGSFDPVTRGHLDIIGRSAKVFDEVIVAVLMNQSKQGMFDLDERLEMLRDATKEISNVRVESFQGLLVDYCRDQGAQIVIKGLRVASDFDYELQMAQMNIHLSGVETLFMPTNPIYSFIASSLVKEVAKGGGDVSTYVTEFVERRLAEKFHTARSS
jgi:pantetheine-phosphate adenylyltransferase